MIVASIKANSNQQAIQSMNVARAKGADIAEIRLDYIKNPDPEYLVLNRKLPVIVTLRSREEGGSFAGTIAEKMDILDRAAIAGAEYIDIEARYYKSFPTRVIASIHDLESTDSNLIKRVKDICKFKPFIVKVATRINSSSDLLLLLGIREKIGCKYSIIGLGEFGVPTRALYKKIGCHLTYGSLETGSETAQGQLTVDELVRLSSKKKTFVIVGYPLGHSASPVIYNKAFEMTGINASYIKFPLTDVDNLNELLDAFNVQGASVTLPYKTRCIPQLDSIDISISNIDAVNTIIRRRGKYRGYNTDVYGAIQSLKTVRKNLRGTSVLLLGAGGTAKAILYGLVKEGAIVTISNRTLEKAKKLAKIFNCDFKPLSNLPQTEIVINATSVGLNEDRSIISKSVFTKRVIAFDVVYKPRLTKFLKDARSKGATIIYGTKMLLNQARKQFEIFTGRSLPDNVFSVWKRLIHNYDRHSG